jgi:hypothetical protein
LYLLQKIGQSNDTVIPNAASPLPRLHLIVRYWCDGVSPLATQARTVGRIAFIDTEHLLWNDGLSPALIWYSLCDLNVHRIT